MADFFDDGSSRDLTPTVADLLLEFLLRPVHEAQPGEDDQVPVMEFRMTSGSWEDCRLVLKDSSSGVEEEIPGSVLPQLLAAAVSMAIADAAG